MHISWARLASFCHLGFISDPLIVSKFHNETHDPKGQENKIYTIVKGRDTFYRRHTVPVTSCSEIKYVLKRVSFGSKVWFTFYLFLALKQEYMLEMFIKYPHLLTGVVKDDNVDAAEKFLCLFMELKKRLSMVLIMPGIVFLWKIFSCCLVWCLTSETTDMVMFVRSVQLTTLFLSWASYTKRFASTSCTYFHL